MFYQEELCRVIASCSNESAGLKQPHVKQQEDEGGGVMSFNKGAGFTCLTVRLSSFTPDGDAACECAERLKQAPKPNDPHPSQAAN